MKLLISYLLIGSFFLACNPPQEKERIEKIEQELQIAHLSKGELDAFEGIRASFSQNNPGYDLAYHAQIEALKKEKFDRILFVQEGDPDIELSSGIKSKTTVGDIILLNADVGLKADSLMSILAFQVPEAPEDSIPRLIRPDWDMNITDVPGGCATDSNAYRRILLTWKQEVGHYLYHALNAHRVRIMDSFTHYHPKKGGFDEFYLVQMAMPSARIITSSAVGQITQPQSLSKEACSDLLQSTDLEVGDLVYLPRGTIHRGIGGVLAQVITVPGFIPGSEIGVDHHLKSINERFGFYGAKKLPFNLEASKEAIVK